MDSLYHDYFIPNLFRMRDYLYKDLEDMEKNLYTKRTLVMFNFDNTKKGMVNRLSTLCGAIGVKTLTYTFPKNLTEKDIEDIMELLNFTQETIADGIVFLNMHEQIKFLLDYLEPKQDIAALTSMSKYISPMAKGVIEYFDNTDTFKLTSLTTIYVNIYDNHCADLIDVLHERSYSIVWEDDDVAYDKLVKGCDIVITDHSDIASEYKHTAQVVLDNRNIMDLTSLALLENLVYERDKV